MIKKKPFAFVFVLLSAGSALAQAPVDLPPQTLTRTDNSTSPISILPSLEGGKNFVNFNGFVNGVFDSTVPVFQNGTFQGNSSVTGAGVETGGSIGLLHSFATGQFMFTYMGDFRDYTTSFYPPGTDQNVNLYFRKALNRRWTLNVGANGGMFSYGSGYYPLSSSLVASNLGQGVIPNPFSRNTKFLSSSISLTYQQSARLSYTVGGDFYLNRYYGAGSFGSTGGDGMASISYRLTRATTLSGSYTHSYYGYQGAAGSSAVDGVNMTVSHNFHRSHWQAGASVGISHVNSQGIFSIPEFLPVGVDQQLTPVLIQGMYHTVSTVPSFTGTATRSWKRTSLSLSGGQSVNPGNGFYLASRNLFFSSFYNINYRRANLSFGGTYSQLNSLANKVANGYSSAGAEVAYNYKLTRYFGLNAHYNLTYYGSLGSYGGRVDNRISFGVIFFSSNVPFSYF